MSRKTLDNNLFINELLTVAANGNMVSLCVVGNSMSPFLINERDFVYFSSLISYPKRGDIVLFQRHNGMFILHRVYRIDSEGRYYFLGDAEKSCDIEGPIERDQIRAKITMVNRKGVMLDEHTFLWLFFKYIWIRCVMLRKPMIKILSFLYTLKNKLF